MIRTTPQPGDIGLTSVSGPVGKLIKFLQFVNGDGFSRYQHAFLVLDGGELIEAMPGGAQIVPLSEYDGKDVLYVSPASLTDADRERICAAARKFEGIPYGWLDYAALTVHRLRIPAPGLRTFIAAEGSMICSQLCDRAYQVAGIPLFSDKRWSGYITPGALYRQLA